MSGQTSIAGKAAWLEAPALQLLLAALNQDGEEARIAGGAVRNALLGQEVCDVDIATTNRPEETVRLAEAAGFKTVATGAAHGTITVIAKGKPYEVTTLRADVETDGRHAKVRFGRDWKQDADRRDFTINALYATAEGQVIDLVGGLADLEARRLRFIGDPEARIREDFLRILRFFRFFAWYGDGRPDAEGLKACARLKEGLDRLSAERVWAELKKLLTAPDPSRALLWMRQSGVLTRILPESEKWGIDAIHALAKTERDLGWEPDALLRLAVIVPPDSERLAAMAGRLRLSRAEAERLVQWAKAPDAVAERTEGALAKMLYRGNPTAIIDRLKLAFAAARGRAVEDDRALVEAGGFSRQLAFAEAWVRPVFPLRGNDLAEIGGQQGRKLGDLLRELEGLWVETGFTLDRDALLERAAERLGN